MAWGPGTSNSHGPIISSTQLLKHCKAEQNACGRNANKDTNPSYALLCSKFYAEMKKTISDYTAQQEIAHPAVLLHFEISLGYKHARIALIELSMPRPS
jgi:hypothetical protein